MDHTNGSCDSCVMAAADQYVKNNTTRSWSVHWQRPRRIPLARHIFSLEVALDVGRVTVEFGMLDRSPYRVIRIFNPSCPPEVFIWSVNSIIQLYTLWLPRLPYALVRARASQPESGCNQGYWHRAPNNTKSVHCLHLNQAMHNNICSALNMFRSFVDFCRSCGVFACRRPQAA